MIIRTEVEPELHRRFKLACVEKGEPMQRVLLELVRKFTEESEKKKAKK